jgi:hypothetical protein
MATKKTATALRNVLMERAYGTRHAPMNRFKGGWFIYLEHLEGAPQFLEPVYNRK